MDEGLVLEAFYVFCQLTEVPRNVTIGCVKVATSSQSSCFGKGRFWERFIMSWTLQRHDLRRVPMFERAGIHKWTGRRAKKGELASAYREAQAPTAGIRYARLVESSERILFGRQCPPLPRASEGFRLYVGSGTLHLHLQTCIVGVGPWPPHPHHENQVVRVINRVGIGSLYPSTWIVEPVSVVKLLGKTRSKAVGRVIRGGMRLRKLPSKCG